MLKKTNTSGFTLVEIMIVVAIIALLAAIAIPNLLRAKMASNDAAAKATLRTLSTSAETFATANEGSYPTATTDLTGATPAYFTTNYCDGTVHSGFVYACTWGASSYTITATPDTVGTSGSQVFTVTTGGDLQ